MKTKKPEVQKELVNWKEKASEKLSHFSRKDKLNYLQNYQAAFDCFENVKGKTEIKSNSLQ